MKIDRKGTMKDGTHIQIEDWSANYSCYKKKRHIVAYPKNKYGEKIRAEYVVDEAGIEGLADMVFDGIQTTDDLIELGFTTKKCGRDVPFMEA